MVRTLTVVAAGLIVLGVVAMFGPTFGFSTVAGDRGVMVSTADGDSALLGTENIYDDSEITNKGNGNQEEVVRLFNNFERDIDSVDTQVTTIDGYDGDTLEISNRVALLDDGINEGDEADIELRCSGDVREDGTANVTVTIFEAKSDAITVQDAEITVTDVVFDCQEDDSGGDDPADDPTPISETKFEVDNEQVLGNRGARVNFDLINTGTVDVITGIEIRSTNPDTDRVSTGNGDNEVFIEIQESGETGSLDTGNRNTGVAIGGGLYGLDTTAKIDENEVGTVELTEFTGEGNGRNPVDMTGGEVDMILDFENEGAVRFTLNLP